MGSKWSRSADGTHELHYEGNAFPLARRRRWPPDRSLAGRLDAQHYVLEYFKSGSQRVNYRRFFDVSSLAGVRVEDDSVFDWNLTRRARARGGRHGRRAAHRITSTDSVIPPRLRRVCGVGLRRLACRREDPCHGRATVGRMAIDGTTGYEFGALVTSLLLHPPGLAELTGCYQQFTGDSCDFSGPFARRTQGGSRHLVAR